MRACHNTHHVPVHNIAFDEKPAYGGNTSQIVTDCVPTHTTTFVHAGAWIVTFNLLCGVPAHTTTVFHAGAWTVTIYALFDVPAHTTTLVHAGAWTVTTDSLFGVPARTKAFVHAGTWAVTNDYVPQQCTPRIRTSTYAVPIP